MKDSANHAASASARSLSPSAIQCADIGKPAAAVATAQQDAWVINLKRRPDRLENFYNRLAPLRPFLDPQRFEAIDCQQLELGALAPRINPWWRELLTFNEIAGHIAIALSHLGVWELAAKSPARMVLIFEDDAAFARRGSSSTLQAALRRAPPDADLIWLNVDIRPRARGQLIWIYRRCLRAVPPLPAAYFDWPMLGSLYRLAQFWPWPGAFLKTTEAYLITPAFARVLHDKVKNDLGPVDILVRDWIERLGARSYELRNPIFTQANRMESDRDLSDEG